MTYPQPIGFSDLLGWNDEDHGEILSLFSQQTAQATKHLIRAAQNIPPDQARKFFEDYFQPMQFGPAFAGHVTGYYEPILAGKTAPDADFKYPLYAPPRDLSLPWHTRHAIEQGDILSGRALELVYLNSRVDQYFVHIQGSVAVDYPDGTRARFGFAAKNGHPYRSIGQVLIARGEIAAENITADWVKSWLNANPEQMDALFWENPSYIFFAPRQTAGAVGAAGDVLSPHRSIAVDPAYIPYGLPVMIARQGHEPRLYLAQDCGSAIKGPQRADIFCGSGNEAGHHAGQINAAAQLTVLWPKGHAVVDDLAG
ncbi:MltA domain-containing protein [Rhodobacteraceae bacterium XHP0102]|nr:MltA domain-containing protein [Rhodobacteraceae bacterium XHP0102]